MANFGFSVGDIVTVGSLAWSVYKACSNASSEFQEVAREVTSLHAALNQLEEEVKNPDSTIHRGDGDKTKVLHSLLQNIGKVLHALENLVSRYKSLDTKDRRKRDVVRFATEGLEDIRLKLILHTNAIDLFLGSLSVASLGRIESKLDEIAKELRSGQRDTSVIAVSDDEDDPAADQQWRALRKELVEDGFEQADIDDHKAWIKAQMRRRIAGGQAASMKGRDTSDRGKLTGDSAKGVMEPPTTMPNRSEKPARPAFENPWPQQRGPVNAPETASSADDYQGPTLPMSHPGMLPLSHPAINDITPRNIYDVRTARSDSSPENPPLRRSPSVSSITSIHSDVSEHDTQGNLVRRTVTTTTTTYYASATDDSGLSDRDHGAYQDFPGGSRTISSPQGPTGVQSMMGHFSSKMSANTQKKHKCKVCDKRFTRPSSLQTHMYSHTGEKPFACSVEGCGRKFSVVSNLRRHKKVHEMEMLGNDADSESEV